jgi:DNA-binding Xre family transcriptional regulator
MNQERRKSRLSITFEPLRETLKRKGLNLNYLRKPRTEGGLGLSSMTTNKISHDDPVSFEVLDTICREMGLRVEEVIRYVEGPYQKAKPRKRDYELPEFLDRSIKDIIEYLELYKALGRADEAYRTFWENKHIIPPNPWSRTLNDVPMVCAQLHPAGGKHNLGLNALDSIFNVLPSGQKKIVVWLEPWLKNIEPTIRMLRLLPKKYREKLTPSFPANVEILTAEQLASDDKLIETLPDKSLTIIVLCVEHFSPVEKDEKQLRYETGSVTNVSSRLGNLKQLRPLLVLDELQNTKANWFIDVNTQLMPSFILELTSKPSKISNIISFTESEDER